MNHFPAHIYRFLWIGLLLLGFLGSGMAREVGYALPLFQADPQSDGIQLDAATEPAIGTGLVSDAIENQLILEQRPERAPLWRAMLHRKVILGSFLLSQLVLLAAIITGFVPNTWWTGLRQRDWRRFRMQVFQPRSAPQPFPGSAEAQAGHPTDSENGVQTDPPGSLPPTPQPGVAPQTIQPGVSQPTQSPPVPQPGNPQPGTSSPGTPQPTQPPASQPAAQSATGPTQPQPPGLQQQSSAPLPPGQPGAESPPAPGQEAPPALAAGQSDPQQTQQQPAPQPAASNAPRPPSHDPLPPTPTQMASAEWDALMAEAQAGEEVEEGLEGMDDILTSAFLDIEIVDPYLLNLSNSLPEVTVQELEQEIQKTRKQLRQSHYKRKK